MKHIVIHCSDSPQGRGDTAATIHRWHQEKRWSGIGYHYVILEDGTIEQGRPEYWHGAHVKGHNRDTLGICLIGQGIYTGQQWAALELLTKTLSEKYPDAKVVGHNELDTAKPCPKFDVSAWWEAINV